MTEAVKEEATDAVQYLVRTGFYDADDVYEAVAEDLFDEGAVDEDWVRGQIKEEMACKWEEETTWPACTDCDRLDSAFRDLNATGIVALQNAGYDQSDGWEDVTEAYHEQGGPQSPTKGYCFYYGQDLERAVDGDGLWLAFGDINGDDGKELETGKRIVAVL